MSTPSGALVEWTLGLQRSDLPSDILEAAHLRLLDTHRYYAGGDGHADRPGGARRRIGDG